MKTRKFFCTLSLFIGIPIGLIAIFCGIIYLQWWADTHWGQPSAWVKYLIGIFGAGVMSAGLTVLVIIPFWVWCSEICDTLRGEKE